MMTCRAEFEIDTFGDLGVLGVDFRISLEDPDFQHAWEWAVRQATQRLLAENQRRIMKGVEL